MITAKEAFKSLKKFIPNVKVLKCYLCDNGYVFIIDKPDMMDNGFFVKETGGVRPLIPNRDFPNIIKEKEVSEYLDV